VKTPGKLLGLALLAAAGCGWHSGLPAPEGARSIGVEAARREGTVLERGLEPLLTDALSRTVVDWVDLELVSPDEADLVIRPLILEYRRRGGVRSGENELLETAVFIRVQAELVDRRTGASRPIAGPAVAQLWSGYSLDVPTNEDRARDRALRHISETLVLDLFGSSDALEK